MWFYCFLILQPAFPRNSISQNGFFACCKNSSTCHSHFVAVQLWHINFLFGRDRTEHPVLHSPVESFADTVYLRAFRLDFEIVYILYRQIQPILMALPVPAIFLPLSVNMLMSSKLCCPKKGTALSPKHTGNGNHVPPAIQLGKSDSGSSADGRLLINMPDPLDGSLCNKCLGRQRTGIIGLHFLMKPAFPFFSLSPMPPPGFHRESSILFYFSG